MYYILTALIILISINFLLLKYSSNSCEVAQKKETKKVNMPERNNYIPQPAMADK